MRHWTPAERQRQSEIIKQWQPWTRSTGARTSEGKAAASRNASTSDATRIAAIKELLDSSYGKPSSMDNTDDELDTPQKQRPVYQLVFLKGNEHLTEDKGLSPPPPNPT